MTDLLGLALSVLASVPPPLIASAIADAFLSLAATVGRLIYE